MAKKFVVVVGGVISGVGKGIAAASIAKILTENGYKTTAIKIDPYINCDAGTLRPTEHGEVWVTSDGGEIDQDLGNYERFIGDEIPKINNITTGQIYQAVIEKERKGEFLGETVQFIPHIPNEIIRRIELASEHHEITVIEVGGTIGDYENIPYLFALKSLERKIGINSVCYVLITFLPVPNHVGEMKTKPTQQAIKLLSQHGIFPDIILCRAVKELDQVRKKKIEIYANIPADMVISAPDISTIYTCPLNFERENLGKKILNALDLNPKQKSNWSSWQQMVSRIINPSREVEIGIVCKYIEIGNYYLEDAYISVKQAIEHAGAGLDCKVKISWISANDLELSDEEVSQQLAGLNGIIVPGGFGTSGIEGKILAIQYARNNQIPYLGLCLGLQLAVVEFARNVVKLPEANTTEFKPESPHPMTILLPSQVEIMNNSRYGATMRLGAYLANIKIGTLVHHLYQQYNRIEKDQKLISYLQSDPHQKFRLGVINNQSDYTQIIERHRHRYEINPQYINPIQQKGLQFSGYHQPLEESVPLMEFIELTDHPFFVATQAHPEFKSRLQDPAPLFMGFIQAAMKNHYEK